MIYKVTLKEGSATIEVIHVRADSLMDAIKKAEDYSKVQWTGDTRVAGIEETNIEIVD